MKFFIFAVICAGFLSFANLRFARAQAICMSDSACGDTGKCANGYCRDLVNCTVNEDCAFCLDPTKCPSDACINYRCKCNSNADCGSIGRCDEQNRCVRTDDPPECGRSCLVNTECSPASPNGTEYSCTFNEDHPYVGLCCPTFVGEPEENFSCVIGQDFRTNPAELVIAAAVACTLMGRIRRRSAAKQANPNRSNPSVAQVVRRTSRY